jgi:LytT family two-component system sensor histidine kinase NatK
MEPNFGYLIPFILFLLVEGIRHHWSNLLHNKNQLIRSQHKEMEQMNETFLVVRKERHDFLKHISALHYMVENKKHVEATNYLDDLVEGYKETNLSIQGERGTVAGLLHQSYMEGKERGIEIVYDLEVSISSFPLSDQDLVALIGNILENALDASSAFQEKRGQKSHITLQTYKRSGLFILTCKNDTLAIPNEILDHLFTKKAQTTKTGNHEGLGTQIIAEIIETHQGFLDFTYKSNTFTLQIKLPAIKWNE